MLVVHLNSLSYWAVGQSILYRVSFRLQTGWKQIQVWSLINILLARTSGICFVTPTPTPPLYLHWAPFRHQLETQPSSMPPAPKCPIWHLISLSRRTSVLSTNTASAADWAGSVAFTGSIGGEGRGGCCGCWITLWLSSFSYPHFKLDSSKRAGAEQQISNGPDITEQGLESLYILTRLSESILWGVLFCQNQPTPSVAIGQSPSWQGYGLPFSPHICNV